jgi:carbonic anhydrase/acetyltransferase-like protein (isoleucine patch superfamily)
MIYTYRSKSPLVHETAFVAPSSDLIGDVTIGSESSIWFQCVLRGDVNAIFIGSSTNVQDHSMLHVTRKTHPLWIGSRITIGHQCTLHGCTILDESLIGMGAILLDGCEIGKGAWVAAGSVVPPGMIVPEYVLVRGAPARVIRSLTEEEKKIAKDNVDHYVQEAIYYRGFLSGPKPHRAQSESLLGFSLEDEG